MGVDQSKTKKENWVSWVAVKRRDGFVKKKDPVLSRRTELPLIRIAAVGDALKLGMAHEQVNAFHSSSLLIVVTIDVSESPVPLFVSTGSPDLIPLVWKAMEFTGSDVGPQ